MPKAYWVTCYRQIKDPDKLAAYAKLAGPAVEAVGGRYIVRGTAAVVHEAQRGCSRHRNAERPAAGAALAPHRYRVPMPTARHELEPGRGRKRVECQVAAALP